MQTLKISSLPFFLILAAWSNSSGHAQSEITETSAPEATSENRSPQISEADVRRLLRRLDGDLLQERDLAEKNLIELGPSVLPFLPEITPRTSGEQKIRLQRIRKAVQDKKLDNFFEASTITLDGTRSLKSLFEEITLQTQNKIQLQNAGGLEDIAIDCDFDKTPFWQVVQTIMSQAKLSIDAYGSTNNELVLTAQRSESKVRSTVSGPFLIEPLSVQSNVLLQSQLDGQLEVSLRVSWEPRFKPVFMQVPMSDVEISLPSGETLKATNPNATPELALTNGSTSTQLQFVMNRPERSVPAIQKLTGKFKIAVPSERHQYVFEKFSNGARQSEKFGDVTVTLEGARRNGSVYEMRILASFGNSQGALESFRSWILSNSAYLENQDGDRLQDVSFQTYSISPNAVGMAYMFQINNNPDEWKLIYDSPASMTTQNVTFEISDLPLP